MGTTLYKKRLFDVRKDRLDLRDRIYQPALRSLPHSFPKISNIHTLIQAYQEAGLILDQGENGACTGFALASTINYLLWRKVIEEHQWDFFENPLGFSNSVKRVSPKMLYSLARIYDEWDGEDYEGSSCRGAMKGWHKHGVCEESCWSFDKRYPNEGWEKEAIECPLGAYYRVEKDSIVDMQSAICEVGALYVSATIHDGWWKLKDFENTKIEDVTLDIPYIPYDEFPKGGHAFVIVGYTRYGFIVQNSWGTNWGNGGFAILSYKDWLEHGMDVWVAVMGAPVDVEATPNTFSTVSLNSQTNEAVEGTRTIQRALQYNYRQDKLQPITEEQAYKHTLVLNSYGRAKHTIIWASSVEDSIHIICYENVKAWLDKDSKNKKVALYALGGFYNEKEYISKIRVLAPYFLENGVYPIFLTWQDSYYRAIYTSIEDFFENILTSSGKVFQAKDILREKEALSRAIENHCRKISTRAIWSEIKEKALNANAETIDVLDGKQGALYILTQAFQLLQQAEGRSFEIHAIGHSAGSQLVATEWLVQLADHGLQLKSMNLIAPTLTIYDAYDFFDYAQCQQLFEPDQIHIHMLKEELELEDRISKYDKSLLVLISRSLEKIHKTPLLGLEKAWYPQNATRENDMFNKKHYKDIENWHRFATQGARQCHQYIYEKNDNIFKSSQDGDSVRISHKNLDRSIKILDKILRTIVHGDTKKRLSCPVENLF